MTKIEIPKIHVHKNGKLFGFGVSPNDDWEILSVVFFILTIFVSALGVYMFVKINEGEIFIVERQAASTDTTLNQGLLKQTVEYYQNRAQDFEKIKAGTVEVRDPSL